MSERKKEVSFSITGLFKANKIFLLELFNSGKWFILFQILSFVIIAPINYWITYAPKKFIDSITVDKNLFVASLWILLMCFLKYIDKIILFTQEQIKIHAFSEAKLKSKEFLYKKIQLIYLTYFENPTNVDVFNKTLSYNEIGGERLINSFIGFAKSVITLGTMTYISFEFDWWIWLAVAIVVIFEYFSEKFMKKEAFEYSIHRLKREREQNYYNGLPTSKESLADIKLNSSIEFFFEKYKLTFLRNRKHSEKHDLRAYIFSLLFSIPNEIFIFICYFSIGIWLLNGKATIGDYTLFFSTIIGIITQTKSIISSVNSFYEQSLSANIYNSFINDPNIFIKASLNNAKSIYSINEIKMKNLSFIYPSSQQKALDNVSISIKQGEKISIVGYNGAGKTTFTKLVTLLFQPTEGEMYINGIPSENIKIYDYWKKISIVFQNPQQYAMSIKDNILLRESSSVDDNLVWKMLKLVGLSDAISNNKSGLNAQLTRNFDIDGIELSGGEKQRLSIAKALAKDADIYIFDEPSSSLDPVAEDELYNCISNIPKDKTIIMISHRLSSVFITDRIIFFKDGRVIADGSHNELIKTCPEYREIYRLQADKFK